MNEMKTQELFDTSPMCHACVYWNMCSRVCCVLGIWELEYYETVG